MASFSRVSLRLFIVLISSLLFFTTLFNWHPTIKSPFITTEGSQTGNETYNSYIPHTSNSNSDCYENCGNNTSSDEKFITYLPHSQFNNQRLELENAILLAYYTNRTLILPPLILGHRNPWAKFDILYKFLSEKLNKNNCEADKYDKGPRKSRQTPRCDTWTKLDWQQVYNLTAIQNDVHVRMITAPGFKVEWIKERLQITDDDIMYFKDDSLYNMKVYDDPQSTATLDNYKKRVDIAEYKSLPHKLMYFNTLFGSGRILNEHKENQLIRRHIFRHFIYIYPKVMETADKIVAKLGGMGSYTSIHVRTTDGYFKANADKIIRYFIEKLTELDSISVSETETKSSKSATCKQKYGRIIYMATDAKAPRRNHKSLYMAFPCILTLSDFEPLLDDLKTVVNEWDNMPMYKFLIPFVDMIVAAKGGYFIGTQGSTFSGYTARLNEMFLDELGDS
jgi:hypothetical protein